MKRCKYIADYARKILAGEIKASSEIAKAMHLIERKLSDEDVFIDTDKTEKAIELIERYFGITLIDWERFVLALMHCYYKSQDTVVFDEFFIMMGRGNGKNGFISGVAWYLTTHYHGVREYNVDIIANSEDQAQTSFDDIYNMLESTWNKSKFFFYKSKSVIKNSKTGSYIKYNTSNAKTKDGKRSACLIFDELHEYTGYEMIQVFQSGFGKRKHSRIFYITTNGYVRDGVIDDQLSIAKDVLNGEMPASGMLPLIYKNDEAEEANQPDMWEKANPSLRYFPELKKEMYKAFEKMKHQGHVKQDFYTKRLNWPLGNPDLQVTSWDNLLAASAPIPNLEGRSCIFGLDTAKVNDFVAAGFWFKDGDKRYFITHSWVCRQSADWHRIKYPIVEAQQQGLLTIVDDVEISPEYPMDWLEKNMQYYSVDWVALDGYRYNIYRPYLKNLGYSMKKDEGGKVKLVRPSDQMMVMPVIESLFNTQNIAWGEDNSLMRWYTNNTKLESVGINKSRGNYTYGKIEPKSRKTDGFMAMVAAATMDNELPDYAQDMPDFDVFVY